MLTKKWALAGATVALLALSGCAGESTGSDGGGDADPITLAMVAPLSGAFADTGAQIGYGAQVAIDEINEAGGVLDRPLEIEKADTADGAQASVQAIRDFSADGNELIFGELSSANCLALAPLVDELGSVFITTTCTNDDLTGHDGEPAPYERFFRVGATSEQDMLALARTMHDAAPEVTTYDVFAFDYVSGHLQWEQFSTELAELGMQLSADVQYFVPLDEQNYTSQISALAGVSENGEKRGLYLGTYGSGTSSFINQGEQYGLFDNYDVVVNSGSYWPIATSLGGAAPEVYNGYDYNYLAYDSDANQAFVDAYTALAGTVPDTWGYQGYLAVKAYAAAIESAGDVSPDAVLDALKGISFDTPQGEYTIDPDSHQGSANIVVTHTVGNADEETGVEVLESYVIPYADTLK
ncbi:ABC transporter substrate-binding protein [Microbacterium pseudoresistens]|uniref:Branched-chain amino acid transport system substrate-binding protein n=1 Tax=Microbacterium pseudoresistens TaxID=640634 RepID=A0A7Y9EUW9_9MICO|nr:branched-chain amino acid transport system substrate-binding protein [Microbacterium pseudoresistens]